MALFKAMSLGLLAASGIPAALRNGDGMMGVIAHWHALDLKAGGIDLLFSLPIFLGVTLFCWGFFHWSRE